MNSTTSPSSRWNSRSCLPSRLPSRLPAPSGLRVEVCPPSLRCAPNGLLQRLLFWLLAPAPGDAAPPLSRLPAVRLDFMATLADIESLDADTLRERIRNTRSLRELWHLRTEIHRQVGLAHSEWQAGERLTLLNHHFPTRAPRSQLAGL